MTNMIFHLKQPLLAVALLLAAPAVAQVEEVLTEEVAPVRERPYQRPERIKQNGKFGFSLGDFLVVPPEFIYLPRAYNKFMVAARPDSSYGIIDGNGQVLHPFEYENGGYVFGQVLFLSKKGLQRFFDNTGKLLFELHFDGLDKTQTFWLNDLDRLVVRQNGLTGIVDQQSRILFPFKYPTVLWVEGTLVGVADAGGKAGLANWSGREIIRPQYERLEKIDPNGLMEASLGPDQNGLIDSTGRVVVPLEYNYCTKRLDAPNLYVLKKDGYYGMTDASGQFVLPVNLSSQPHPVAYNSVRWEKDSIGVRITKNELVLGAFVCAKTAPEELSLYHVNRGFILKGDYATFDILNDDGPVVASKAGQKPVLYSLDGRVLLAGDFKYLVANPTRTILFAGTPDKRIQLYRLDGALLYPESFWFDTGRLVLPHGFLALSDAANTFALFDPIGNRITPHRYVNLRPPLPREHTTAREQGFLQPGRVLLAIGTLDAEGNLSEWIDNTGAVVK